MCEQDGVCWDGEDRVANSQLWCLGVWILAVIFIGGCLRVYGTTGMLVLRA